MKKRFLSAMVLTVLVAAPVQAINHKYAEQLTRSGCTQDNDQVTCDSSKSKEWNRTHTYHPPAPKKLQPAPQSLQREAASINGMQKPAAEAFLSQHGWKKDSGSKYVWFKGSHNLDYTMKDGYVDVVTVR